MILLFPAHLSTSCRLERGPWDGRRGGSGGGGGEGRGGGENGGRRGERGKGGGGGGGRESDAGRDGGEDVCSCCQARGPADDGGRASTELLDVCEENHES